MQIFERIVAEQKFNFSLEFGVKIIKLIKHIKSTLSVISNSILSEISISVENLYNHQ